METKFLKLQLFIVLEYDNLLIPLRLITANCNSSLTVRSVAIGMLLGVAVECIVVTLGMFLFLFTVFCK